MADPAAPPSPLIEFDQGRKQFGEAPPALGGLSFTVTKGQLVVLTGANGAGKSTVLRLIAGLLAPDGGRVLIAGEETTRLRRAARVALRRATGVMPQDLRLLADRSVLENVMLPALAAGRSRREAMERASAALQRVGLADGRSMPTQISAGARQRAALARAIVNRPPLLLVDEPTAFLDAATADDILERLDEFAQAGVTVVMASHGERVSLPPTARRLRLVEGRLAE
jgi:cell division transport system ATP-binding protein